MVFRLKKVCKSKIYYFIMQQSKNDHRHKCFLASLFCASFRIVKLDLEKTVMYGRNFLKGFHI